MNRTAIRNAKISYRVFNAYTSKSGDFEDVNKIPRYLKRIDCVRDAGKDALRHKDSRLSYKNRRSINKDWKDFNNNNSN